MKKRTVYKHKLKNKVITGACATAASFALLSGTFLTNAFAQGSLATGTWVENEDVLNKDEAANEASVTAQTDKAPEGFSFDTKEDRLTFLIFYLSGDNQAFNGQAGTDWYIRLSRTRSVYDGVIYADLVDKATGNVIESLTVNPGESLHFSKIKEKNIASFDYSITTSKKEFKAGDESTTLYYVSLDSGIGGSTQGTVKYSSVTKNETDALYNNWAGVVPQSPMSQKTSYVKKSDGSILAEYIQKGGIFGDNYSAAGEAKFEKYELVEAPAVKTGVLNGASVGTYIIEARYSHKEARIKFNTKSDGTQRIAMMIINPNHPDFVNNYNNATLDADFLDINRLSKIIYDDKIPEKDKVKTFNESNPKYVVMFLSKDIAPGEYNKESSGYGDDGTWTYTLNDTLSNGKNEIEGGLTENPYANEPYGDWKIIEYTLNKDGQAYKFGGMISSLKNGNIDTSSDAVYYYANKGGVKVYYIDESGKEIADPAFVLPYADSNTEYNTEDERYTKITAQDGEVYYFKEIDSNIKNPSESDESNGFRTVVKITDEQGQVVQNTLKELSYVYEKAGNVNINYVNTDGEVIKKKVNDVVNGEPGSDYDTTTADKKPEKIVDDNGKTYVYKEIKNG